MGSRKPGPEPPPLAPLPCADAWTVDRLRRSSFPPSHVPAAHESNASLPPSASTDEGDAMSLVERSQPTSTMDLESEMAERFALGDYSGSLRAAELLLGRGTGRVLAEHYARESRAKLEALYTSRLSVRGNVPQLAISESELTWLGLEARAAQLLARVDGHNDIAGIISLSGIPRLDALRLLAELTELGVIRLV